MPNKKMSEFLQFAYKNNRVRDLSEAFQEFAPEEEYHQGNTEVFLKEKTEQYDSYQIGDIVFVSKYLYSNGQEGKNHLFVIVEQNNIAVPIENFGMLISSKIEKAKYQENKFLKANNKNGLDVDSIVKTDVIYKIDNENILFKIGNVDFDKIEKYKQSFLNYNKNNETILFK